MLGGLFQKQARNDRKRKKEKYPRIRGDQTHPANESKKRQIHPVNERKKSPIRWTRTLWCTKRVVVVMPNEFSKEPLAATVNIASQKTYTENTPGEPRHPIKNISILIDVAVFKYPATPVGLRTTTERSQFEAHRYLFELEIMLSISEFLVIVGEWKMLQVWVSRKKQRKTISGTTLSFIISSQISKRIKDNFALANFIWKSASMNAEKIHHDFKFDYAVAWSKIFKKIYSIK
uniref:Uncharacterized protein n=1 Tax=Parascaris equorum TaxID=6256 RepID=A0A914RYH5_PAREQ